MENLLKKKSKLDEYEIRKAILKTVPKINVKNYNTVLRHILTNMFEQT